MFNLDDPKTLALITAGLGLLGGAPGQRKNVGADLSHGLLGGLQAYQQGKQFNTRQAEEEQQRKMRELQLDEMKRSMGVRQKMGEAAQRNVVPGMPQMQPTDFETPSGPAGPSTFNFQGYANDLMGAGPEGVEKALGILSNLRAQNAPVKMGKDDRLVDPRTHREIMPAAPNLPTGMTMGANGPEYMPGYLRGQKEIRAAGKPETNVNLPRPDRAILKVDEERLGEYSAAAAQWRRVHQSAAVIHNQLKGKGGGDIVKLGAETKRFLGLQSDTIAANDLAESLNTMLATQIRAPGSGSTSNMEFEAYKAAAPSLKSSEQGRELMMIGAKRFADRNAKLADHARVLIRKGEYSDEAMNAYDEKLGPVLDESMKKKMGLGASTGTPDDPLGIRR